MIWHWSPNVVSDFVCYRLICRFNFFIRPGEVLLALESHESPISMVIENANFG